jgi:hypothetical protein
MASCSSIARDGSDTDLQYNSIQCRLNQIVSPAANLTTACPAASPVATSPCDVTVPTVSTCVRYCTLLYEACAPGTPLGTAAGFQANPTDCVTRCGEWQLSGITSVDSFQCHASKVAAAKTTLFTAVTTNPLLLAAGITGTGSGKAEVCMEAGRVSLSCNAAYPYLGPWYPVDATCKPDALSTGCCCAAVGTTAGGLPILTEPNQFQFGAGVIGGGCFGQALVGGNFTVMSNNFPSFGFTGNAFSSTFSALVGGTVTFNLTFTPGTQGGQIELTSNLFSKCPANIFCRNLDSSTGCPAQVTQFNGTWVGKVNTTSDGSTGCLALQHAVPEVVTIRSAVNFNDYVTTSLPVYYDASNNITMSARNKNYVIDNKLKIGSSCSALVDTTSGILTTVNAGLSHVITGGDTLTLTTCEPYGSTSVNQSTCSTLGSQSTCNSSSICHTFIGQRATRQSRCERYCGLVMASCSIYTSYSACVEACAAFPQTGLLGDTSFDTVQCRLTYATQASQGTSASCALAASTSTACTGTPATADITCSRYCSLYQQNCQGLNNYMGAYLTYDQCVSSCNTTETTKGVYSSTATNSLGCRLYQIAQAGSGTSSYCKSSIGTEYCTELHVGARDKFIGSFAATSTCVPGASFGECCCVIGKWNITSLGDGNPFAFVFSAQFSGGAACAGNVALAGIFNLTSDNIAKFSFPVPGLPVAITAAITYQAYGQLRLTNTFLSDSCASYGCKDLTNGTSCPIQGSGSTTSSSSSSSSSSTGDIEFSGVAHQSVSTSTLIATLAAIAIIKLYIA